MARHVLSVRRYLQPDSPADASAATGHIGKPVPGQAIDDDNFELAGWCAAAQRRFTRLVAYVDGARTELSADLPSPDVAAAQPELAGAAACRFRASVALPRAGRDQLVQLFAEDPRGHLAPFGEVLVGRPESAGELAVPVFVVGSPRSGTTILGNTLRYCLGLKGFDESHVLPLLTQLRAAAKAHYESRHYSQMRQTKGQMIAALPLSLVESGLAEMFRDLYAAFHGDGRFVDKNPGPDMLRAIPGLLLAWPNARFVFAKRRAIENLVSRTRKFGVDRERFRGHCKDWAEAMELWRSGRDAIPAAQRIEIDQLEIARDPQGVAARLGAFLKLPERAAAFAEYMASHTPQKTTSDDWKSLELAETGWDAETLAAFQEICGPAMAAFGYSSDAAYWAEKNPKDAQSA